MPENEFLAVLNSCEGAAEKTELNESWLPPAGEDGSAVEYEVLLTDLSTGVTNKNGVVACYVKPKFELLGGEYKGKTFEDFFYFKQNEVESSIGMKNMLTLATLINGSRVRSSTEAGGLLIQAKTAKNVVLVVRRVDKPKKDGSGTNRYINYVRLVSAV